MLIETQVKILVVEDDEDVRDAITRTLQEDGFGVEPAADGVAGLYHALNWDFDAIVLDVMMPGMDG